jgi:hypothetical protein
MRFALEAISIEQAVLCGELDNFGLADPPGWSVRVVPNKFPAVWHPYLGNDPGKAMLTTGAGWTIRIESQHRQTVSQSLRCRQQNVGPMPPLGCNDDPESRSWILPQLVHHPSV